MSAVRPGTSELLVPAAQCNNEKSGFGLNVVKADPTFSLLKGGRIHGRTC